MLHDAFMENCIAQNWKNSLASKCLSTTGLGVALEFTQVKQIRAAHSLFLCLTTILRQRSGSLALCFQLNCLSTGWGQGGLPRRPINIAQQIWHQQIPWTGFDFHLVLHEAFPFPCFLDSFFSFFPLYHYTRLLFC